MIDNHWVVKLVNAKNEVVWHESDCGGVALFIDEEDANEVVDLYKSDHSDSNVCAVEVEIREVKK